jgi:hypothetical protein
MDEWLREAGRQVPGLVLMFLLVLAFLKHLDKRNARDEAIAKACHDVITASSSVVEKNSEALGRNAAVMENVQHVVERCANVQPHHRI